MPVPCRQAGAPAGWASLRRRGNAWRRGPRETAWARPPAAGSAAPRSRGCGTSARPAAAAAPRRRGAPPTARCGALPHASHSCAFILPVALQARIGHEQLFRSDVGGGEFHGHLQLAAPPGHRGDHAHAELAVTHPLALHVARPVLRHVFDRLFLHAEARPGPAAAATPVGTIPERRGAALLDDSRGQRFEETGRLGELEAPTAIARPRPREIQPFARARETHIAQPALLLQPARL